MNYIHNFICRNIFISTILYVFLYCVSSSASFYIIAETQRIQQRFILARYEWNRVTSVLVSFAYQQELLLWNILQVIYILFALITILFAYIMYKYGNKLISVVFMSALLISVANFDAPMRMSVAVANFGGLTNITTEDVFEHLNSNVLDDQTQLLADSEGNGKLDHDSKSSHSDTETYFPSTLMMVLGDLIAAFSLAFAGTILMSGYRQRKLASQAV